jgi:group I intron endonuclease
MNKTHYTYIITEIDTGNFYVGSRSCIGKAKNDDYMGSMIVWKPNKTKLVKTILNDNFTTRDEAILEEVRLIKQNIENSLNQNYNIPGLGFHNTGRVFSVETKNKMSKSKMGSNNPLYGKTHSTETILKMKIKSIGRKHNEKTIKKMSESHIKKQVIQFNKEMVFIAEYNSIKEASILTNTDKGDISKVCNNKQKTAGGYIWKIKY